MTRSAMMMAQSALAPASGSNEELYGKMIAQAESAVKEAEEMWGSRPVKLLRSAERP